MKNLSLFFLIILPFLAMAQKPKLVVPIGHTSIIMSVAFSPDGKYVLTGSWDRTAKLWDMSGKEIQTFQGHTKKVYSVAFSPDGKYVLTGSFDHTAKLWDLGGREIKTFRGHTAQILSVAFSPDGKYILTGSMDNSAKLWDRSGTLIKTFQGHTGWVNAVAFSPDGQYILTGSKDAAAKLWDLSGKNVKTFQGHSKSISSVAFSPDAKQVLTGSSDNTAKLWDMGISFMPFGIEIKTFQGHSGAVSSVAFSPNGKYVMTGSFDYTGKLWDLTGRNLKSFIGHTSIVHTVAFSPDGKYVLTGGTDDTANMWDLSGKEIQAFEGHTSSVSSVAFSPDGNYILAAGRMGYPTRLWDLSGRQNQSLSGHTNSVMSVDFSKDGKFLLTGCGDETAKIWDLSGKEIQSFQGHSAPILSATFSPNGKNILTGGSDNTARLWNLSGKEIQAFQGKNSGLIKWIWSVAFSPDGQYLLTGGNDFIQLWDLTGKEVQAINVSTRSVSFSPDGKYILSGNFDKTAKLWDFSGKEIQSFRGHASFVQSIAFSPDGKYILTGSGDATAKLWDISGNEIQTFRGHVNEVTSVVFSPDGQYILTSSSDGTVKFWNRSGKEIATLINVNVDDWIVTTPSGLFDASPGAMGLMHYIQGLEVIELEQLKERYYEPGLLSKLLGFQEGEIREVTALKEVALYPETQASIQQDQLNISLKARNGGIGKVSIFVNNKEVLQDANPSRKTALGIDLKQFAKFYTPGKNKISLRVYNSDGWLKSAEIVLAYTPTFVLPKGSGSSSSTGTQSGSGKISLYAISIGTADYSGDKLDLTFAGKDAISMEAAFKGAGEQLFLSRVHSYLLSTEEGQQSPSKTNIKKAFQEIAAQAQPQDIVLVYLSGHGVTYGPAEKANFFYLTKDIGSENISDTEIRNSYAISDNELTTWMTDIPALKQVMIVDACNSGKVVENLLAGKKKLNSTQVRALDRMKDRTGMFVLAGSAADKVSYEATQYGQGLLTYSLLSGMSGRAIESDGRVDVMKLFQFSRDEVPTLAKSINGIQTPMLAFPTGGSSFDIGIVKEGVNIPVSQVKPVFVRCNFQDENVFDDVLKLSDKVSQYLMDLTAKGAAAKLVYVNSSAYDENSYSIKGRYTQSGNTVTVNARLFKGEANVAPIEVTGNKSDMDALVKMIMREAYGHL